MLRSDLPDHRRSTEPELLDALRSGDPLALAEAYHRTIPAAHAVARRLFSSTADVEALLDALYRELWQDPPADPLEAWVRRRTFELGAAELHERGTPPASPSLATLLPELPAPEVRFLDAAERSLGELGDGDRVVLLAAHDRGLAAAAQGDDAPTRLHRALRTLGGPDAATDADIAADPCDDLQSLGDWVLGLVEPETAQRLEQAAAERAGCGAVTRALRRGRRRLEGLPPTPDMGQRVLVRVLAASTALRTPGANGGGPAPPLGSALDSDAGADEATGEIGPLPTAQASPASPATTAGPDGVAVSADKRDEEASAQAETPYRELAEPAQDEPQAPAQDEDDEPVVWEYDELDEADESSSAARRLLRVVGFLLLIAAGSVVGLYLGTLLVS